MKTIIKDFININPTVPPGKYDVELKLPNSRSINSEDANLELWITLRVSPSKNERKVGQYVDSSNKFKFDKWSDLAWQFFLGQLESQANQVWDRKLWFTFNKFRLFTPEFQKVKNNFLITQDAKTFRGNISMYLYCRPITCRFKIQLVTERVNPHHDIDVFFVTPTGTEPPTNLSMGSTSSNMDFYDYLFTEKTNQSVMAHEVGHILGLPHIGVTTCNEDCIKAVISNPSEGGNANICYFAKGKGVETINNIMGWGNVVDERNANPWQKALFGLTGIPTNYWDISLVKQTANSVGSYGNADEDSPLWREYHPLEKYNNWFKKDNWWERAI